MSMALAYNYCIINLETGRCLASLTMSYEVINDAYILVPDARNEYVDKYYNREDGLWYYDAEFTQPFDINEV